MKTWFELKYSLRVLSKTPGHTLMSVAVVTLSLCIGIIALTLTYNLVFKSLSYKNSDRWVHMTTIRAPGAVSDGGDSIDSFQYQYIKDHNTVFETLGAVRAFSRTRVDYGESATQVSSAEITPHIFEAAGLQAHLGRSLQSSDSVTNNEVAVISYSLWQNYFSNDPNIIGKTFNFDEVPLTIVGVMSKDTAFGMKHDLWIASEAWIATRPDANNIQGITPVGVLKPGVSLKQAQAELSRITEQLKTEYPDFYTGTNGVLVSPFKQFLIESSAPIFIVTAAMSCLIVLLGCINIANLLISRTIERRQEFAIRGCLGSTAFDALRRSLSETFFICCFGAAVSLPLILLAMKGINFYLVGIGTAQGWSVPTDWLLHLDGTTLVIAAAILGFIWLICGLGPAYKLRRLKINELLNGSKGTSDQNSFRTTKVLVGMQIVASFFLLVVSGSLLVSILKTVNMDYGLETNNRIVVSLEFPGYLRDPEKISAATRTIENELLKQSSIVDAKVVAGLPHQRYITPFSIEDRDISTNGVYPSIKISVYSSGAFELLGIDIISGRSFDNVDMSGGNRVIIVDKHFAEQQWPGQTALGKQVHIPAKTGERYTVIGVSAPVVAGMRFANFNRENTVYIPMSYVFASQLEVLVQTESSVALADVFAQVREAVVSTDGGIAVFNARTLADHLLGPTSGLQLIGNIFIGFGLVAVVLAIVGVFAVISRSVLQQTRAIGIRRAIGSSNLKILALYFKQGCVYLLIGLLVGGGSAVLVNNSLSRFFVDLPRFTPMVSLIVILGLGTLVIFASLAPAKKALKFEPGDALHQN